jgi:hypothetical protein
MTTADTRAAHDAPSLVRWLRIFALALAVYATLQNIETVAHVAGILPGAGGIGLDATVEDPVFSGLRRVTSTDPGSPAALAGIVPGDMVRTDPPWLPIGYALAGEHFQVTVVHNGHVRRAVLVAQPHDAPDFSQLRYAIALSISAVFGLLIVLRGGKRADALLLGMALLAFGRPYLAPQPYESVGSLFVLSYGIDILLNAAVFQLFFAFALAFDRRMRGETVPWGRSVLWLTTGAAILEWGLVWLTQTWQLPGYSTAFWVAFQSMIVPVILTLAVLWIGRWRAALAQRRRYTLMLAACVPLFASQIISNQIYDGSGFSFTSNPLQIFSDVLSGILTPALLAYAILRERVIDLGFAINRTLVFSIVSAILLSAFGITEWGVEHILKIEGREANAVIDAGIALALFLGFHRVQHSVRHFVERLFFHKWQAAERALRTFVRRASFVTRADRLAADFTAAAGAFVGGAAAAIYLRGQQGALMRVAGDLGSAPEALDPDLAPVLAARAELQPVELDGCALPAALLVPMAMRQELGGILLLGPKPNGEPYRPDQIELLHWAAGQIGLDLNALEVERLEALAEGQRGEIATLRTTVEAIGRMARAPA